jgi:hypothetical protein
MAPAAAPAATGQSDGLNFQRYFQLTLQIKSLTGSWDAPCSTNFPGGVWRLPLNRTNANPSQNKERIFDQPFENLTKYLGGFRLSS